MTRWNIERTWVETGSTATELAAGSRQHYSTPTLRRHQACVLLGAAGLGKTAELRRLAELEGAEGQRVEFVRLADSNTTEAFERTLSALTERLDPGCTLYLDALDEVMIPVRTASTSLRNWIAALPQDRLPRFRLSCRSTVWPDFLETAIRDKYTAQPKTKHRSKAVKPTSKLRVFTLLSLSDEQISDASRSEGIDSESFQAAIEASTAHSLAEQPLTLKLLFKLFRDNASALPASRDALFDRAVTLLAQEPAEREDAQTSLALNFLDLISAAEVIACVMLLSGAECIDLNTDAGLGAVSSLDLQSHAAGLLDTSTGALRALSESRLFEGHGPRRFRFLHRQVAEYLAGRRIAKLPMHQSRTLLSSGLGWAAGVAAPLRDVAIFAAMRSDSLAKWLALSDPEIIGATEVSDDGLRRRAVAELIARFRDGRYTRAQLTRDLMDCSGLQYGEATDDLRPLFLRAATEPEDLLHFLLELVKQWRLTAVADDLASVVLNANAPIGVRLSAGYALLELKAPTAQARLLPLIKDNPCDPARQLRGIALRCNWPDRISVPTLLEALATAPVRHHDAAYDSFLYYLDREGFEAQSHRVEGLHLAARLLCGTYSVDWRGRIAHRIAIGALKELHNDSVVDALSQLLVAAAKLRASSPLIPVQSFSGRRSEAATPTRIAVLEMRRRLIDAIVRNDAADEHECFESVHDSRLIEPSDFAWLISRATDDTNTLDIQKRYMSLTRLTDWDSRQPDIDLWLAHREHPAVGSEITYRLSIDLESDLSSTLRSRWLQSAQRDSNNGEKKRPRSRFHRAREIGKILTYCETEDPLGFRGLHRVLTFSEADSERQHTWALDKSIGWERAQPDVRTRILTAAKRYLETDSPTININDDNSYTVTPMLAMHLLQHQEPQWLTDLPDKWWSAWAWYILRVLWLDNDDKTSVKSRALISLVLSRAPQDTLAVFERLCSVSDRNSEYHVDSLLTQITSLSTPGLDEQLFRHVSANEQSVARATAIGHFLCSRNSDRVIHTVESLFKGDDIGAHESALVGLMTACLLNRPRDSWPVIDRCLQQYPSVASQFLCHFAHERDTRDWVRQRRSAPEDISPTMQGQLVRHLMLACPPTTDPKLEGFLSPRHSAAELRSLLISSLGDQRNLEAVNALRSLEFEFGRKYSAFRFARSRAERAYRHSTWSPIPIDQTTKVLGVQQARLIRSLTDAVDATVAAIEDFATAMSTSQNGVASYWDFPKKGPPTPKDETTFSNILVDSLRRYFKDFAVTASRESLVHSRLVSRKRRGKPSSELDIDVTVPATGSATNNEIRIPVEVKLSHNPEAKTGLDSQLVKRYTSELRTSGGVYVLIWTGHKAPKRGGWASVEGAMKFLQEQATSVAPPPLDIRVVVVDVALPMLTPQKTRPRKGKPGSATNANARKAKRKGVARVRKRRRKS